MKILFITPNYKPAYIYGGPTVVISLLAESLVKNGDEVTVYTTTANGNQELEVKTNSEMILDGVSVYYFKRYTKDHSHLSPELWGKTFFNARKFDVVHLHSWWNPLIVIAAGICKFINVQPVLSPHGMLCDYIINSKNKYRKKLLLFAGKSLLRNTFLHVSTPMEWEECQFILKGKWQGETIFNLVRLNDEQPVIKKRINKPFFIGFLSRIDPKKGLDLLIMSLSKVKFDYRLQIAGTGNEEYINYLKKLSIEYGNSGKIDWVGWKDNIQKFQFYSSIDLLALTSYNENFAVVVIESLSVGTPVLLSNHVGLSKYISEKQLGWVTRIDDINEITLGLEDAYNQYEKRSFIRNTSANIIRMDFNINYLTDQYRKFYKAVSEEVKK